MKIPDYREIMEAIPDIVSGAGGEISTSDLQAVLAKDLNVSAEALSRKLASGKETVFINNVRWALSYLAVQGYVMLETDGEHVFLNSLPPCNSGFSESPATFDAKANIEEDTDKELQSQFRSAHKKIKSALLGHIHAREAEFFEQLIVDLMLAMGYGVDRGEMSRRLGRSRDGGVDGVIFEDELGLNFFYIQAKRYKPSSTVPISEVRDFAGSLEAHKATRGVFVTTAFLPHSAKKFVDSTTRNIRLIDGDELAELMIRHDLGVKPEPLYVLKSLDEDYFRA